jgi:sulfite reductase (NADPH) flavoprotein alpha-component
MRLQEGTLSVLETALSRVGPEKTYVTHRFPLTLIFFNLTLCRLKSRGEELADLILNQNAYVYICGDGCHMAKDVTRTITEVLHEHGKLSPQEAEKLLDCMKQRRRFVLDIWS